MIRVIDSPVSLKLACLPIIFAACCLLQAQTYKVGSDTSAKPQTQTQPLGWGSNIQTARLARAAQSALQRGDRALALDYAQRAVQANSNDPALWFLLGYVARLDAKLRLSEDAYDRGLLLAPSALDGLSGLAQTYSVAGGSAEAERLLTQVLSSDPRRRNDVLLLGDLYMRSGDYTNATLWLRRAESLQADPRSELLLALSYQRMKQMDSGEPLS